MISFRSDIPLMARIVPNVVAAARAVKEAFPLIAIAGGVNIGNALWTYGACVGNQPTGYAGAALFAASAISAIGTTIVRGYRRFSASPDQTITRIATGAAIFTQQGHGFPPDAVESISR